MAGKGKGLLSCWHRCRWQATVFTRDKLRRSLRTASCDNTSDFSHVPSIACPCLALAKSALLAVLWL